MLQDWLSEAELGQTFDNYDADHSGDISFDEFEKMVIKVDFAIIALLHGGTLNAGQDSLAVASIKQQLHVFIS